MCTTNQCDRQSLHVLADLTAGSAQQTLFKLICVQQSPYAAITIGLDIFKPMLLNNQVDTASTGALQQIRAWCRMSDELQPRQASALLDAQDRNGEHTNSEEALTSKELQEIGSFNSAGSVDKKDFNYMHTR